MYNFTFISIISFLYFTDDPIFLDANIPLINERTFPQTLSRLPLTNSRIWPCNPPAPPSAPVWDRPDGEGGYLLQLLPGKCKM